MKRAVLFLVFLQAVPAFALSSDQKWAAEMDAMLGIAVMRCGVTMPTPIYKSLETLMHPHGFDREVKQFQLARQDHYASVYSKLRGDYCSEIIRAFGPFGTERPGMVLPR